MQCKNHTVLQDSKHTVLVQKEGLWLQSAKWPSQETTKVSNMFHLPFLIFNKIHIKYFSSIKTLWGTLENSISDISIGAKHFPSSYRIVALYFFSSNRSSVLLHIQQNMSCNQYFTSMGYSWSSLYPHHFQHLGSSPWCSIGPGCLAE